MALAAITFKVTEKKMGISISISVRRIVLFGVQVYCTRRLCSYGDLVNLVRISIIFSIILYLLKRVKSLVPHNCFLWYIYFYLLVALWFQDGLTAKGLKMACLILLPFLVPQHTQCRFARLYLYPLPVYFFHFSIPSYLILYYLWILYIYSTIFFTVFFFI